MIDEIGRRAMEEAEQLMKRRELEEQRQQEQTQLRERVSNWNHDVWSRWMLFMFKQGTHNPDGTWTMPAVKVDRWMRQMNTPYVELPEHEKESDRDLADEIFKIVCPDDEANIP